MPTINENLKSLRQASGMTQSEVADIISVARQTVSSYESGRTQPDLETLKRLADVYKVDLHDVLYGGNRLRRRLKLVSRAAIILAAILLLGILTHSVLYLTMNHFFKVTSGMPITAENSSFIETRFAIRIFADAISGICAGVFWIGGLVMLYPAITVVHIISMRRLLIFPMALIIALFAFTVPFAVMDKIFSFDYILPILNSLIVILLFSLVMFLARFIKRRRAQVQ